MAFLRAHRRGWRQAALGAGAEQLESRHALSAAAASANVAHLAAVMDHYHRTFDVYTDVSAAGNHFHGYAKLVPDDLTAAVEMAGGDATNPQSGATAIKAAFRAGAGAPWGGFVLQNGVLPADLPLPPAPGVVIPQQNWGTVPEAGYNLSGVRRLTFWARGEQGGEKLDFFLGGVGWNPFVDAAPQEEYPDSAQRLPAHPLRSGSYFELSHEWQRYSIEIPADRNMSYVLGGFAWVAERAQNVGDVVFYLDNIRYEYDTTDSESAAAQQRRLNEPRFLRSFTTLDRQPDIYDENLDDDFDFKLRNYANIYDNALAVLAFLADGSEDSLRRAKLVGDAIVWAAEHDRAFEDVRLRSAYSAGDLTLPPGWLPNGQAGVPTSPGYYDERAGQFFEVDQRVFDVGNNAWSAIALLALHRATADPAYLATAKELGQFIRRFRNDDPEDLYRGFQGGEEWRDFSVPETDPLVLRDWASSEHNLDAYSLFSSLMRVTGDLNWLADAKHARTFVEAMWDPSIDCFRTGTIDPDTRNENPGQLPLDVQTWSILALPDLSSELQEGALHCMDRRHATASDGFTGMDFNEDRDGVWFEGTAQAGVARAVATPFDFRQVDPVRRELNRAVQTTAFGDGQGIVAASHDGVSTGFGVFGGGDFKYYQRLHVGATAWASFAQRAFNPYYQTLVLLPGDANLDDRVDLTDFGILKDHFGSPGGRPDGDFDGNGRIDLSDFGVLKQNFGLGLA